MLSHGIGSGCFPPELGPASHRVVNSVQFRAWPGLTGLGFSAQKPFLSLAVRCRGGDE